MQTTRSLTALAAVLLLGGLGLSIAAIAGAPLPDADGDGIPDEWDNCTARPNPDQCDTNLDGYGNFCDADVNDDGVVGGTDFNTFRAGFAQAVPPGNPDLDYNCDGVIGGPDFVVFRWSFGAAPGPSGLPCAGTIPCEGL